MPLVRIAVRRGRSSSQLAALRDSVYQAMREVFEVPLDDRFILVEQYEADEFDCDPKYLGIARDEQLVIVQIVCRDTRGPAQKQALYRRMVELLEARAAVRPANVFINLIETVKENWSFGLGVAQYT